MDKQTRLEWLLLSTMALLLFLGNFDFTAVVLALPSISNGFHASISQIQWIITGYIITSASFIVVNKHICHILGKKRAFILRVIIFAITSFLCGFSKTLGWIIAARFLQGIGYALAFPLIYDFIFNIFREERRGSAIGIMHATTAIAQAVGPSLGGSIIQAFGWKLIFYLNIPICIVVLFVAYYILPEKINNNSKTDIFSISNAFIMFSSLAFFMYAINQNPEETLVKEHVFLQLPVVLFYLVFLFFVKEKTSILFLIKFYI